MTEANLIHKSRHALFCSGDHGEFLKSLGPFVNGDLTEFLQLRIAGLEQFSAWLVGSIPVGVATALSDIDILLCVPATASLRLPGTRGQAGVLFCGEQHARRDTLQIGDLVLMANGIELDVSLIYQEGLVALCEQVQRGGCALTSQQILILGRMLRGWLLAGESSTVTTALTSLRDSRALDIHCTVRYLVGAHKHLEDAGAAIDDVPVLAAHLARAAVEKSFEAALACGGELAVGTKWLRRLFALTKQSGTQVDLPVTLLRKGEQLLFPTCISGDGRARAYVEDVRRFFHEIVALISQDAAMRIAILSCAQLRVTTSNKGTPT